MKRIALLGSTGSIGTQALDVVSRDEKQYAVTALTAGKTPGCWKSRCAGSGLAWRCWGRKRRPGS